MTRALVLFVGVLGAGLPLWALGTYPVEDSFSRVLVALILAGLLVGVVGLFLRARALDALLRQLGGYAADDSASEQLATNSPELSRLVDARLRGERPRLEGGEALTRYLVSALVLVGLLGTFVGLVDALVGAREALGVSSDVPALRSALLAPMHGLSRAFGTSVAGISASAMLGLAAIFVRRAELRVIDGVDLIVAGPLKDQTLTARQLAAFEKLGVLGENLPAAVERMAEVASRLPTLEQSLVGGHEALAEALKSSVEKAAAELRAGLERGLADATKAHDELVERAVTKAASVLEERAVALATLFEESAVERRDAEKAWHESLATQTRSVVETLDGSLAKQAERWDASTTSLVNSAEELRRFLDAQKENDRALAEQLRGLLDAQGDGDRALVGELKGFLESQREGDRALAGEMKGFLESQREGDRALVGEMRALVEEQKQSDRDALTRVQTFLEETRAADRALVEDMRAFLRDEKGQALAFSDDIRAQLEGWLGKAAERDETRDQERLALEEKLTAERQALTADVVTHLEAHAAAVREQVTEMARSLSDGADALAAGGVEITALADRFASAVDEYKDATRAWMDRLSTLEVGRDAAGGDDERERFGAYLDQTREVFERSLELQRELFTSMKGGQPGAEEPAAEGEEVVGAEGHVNQPNAEA